MSEYFQVIFPKEYFSLHPSLIKFKTPLKNTIHEAMIQRGWKETELYGNIYKYNLLGKTNSIYFFLKRTFSHWITKRRINTMLYLLIKKSIIIQITTN